MKITQKIPFFIIFFFLFGLCIYLYWPGLNGIFLVDDIYNLNTLNRDGGVSDWNAVLHFVFGNNSGMLGRPVSMLSFLIDDFAYPGSVISYRYTNLMIHCLVGVVAFLYMWTLLRASLVAERIALQVGLIGLGLWLLLPLNVSTTLYIIQRMTQLSALFTLLGLVVFVYGRQIARKELVKGRLVAFFGLYGCAFLAVLSKENGALIFGLALITELSIAYSRKEKSDCYILGITILPIILGGLFFLYKWESITRSSVRDFSTLERLMTESRIIWDYLKKIILPISGKMGLAQDDIIISRGFFTPITTAFSILAHLLLIGLAVYFRKKYIWLFFGVMGFYIGHLLESTVIPLELYFEHRNYLPSVFICFSLAMLMWSRLGNTGIVVLCFLLAISALVLKQRAEIWGNPKAQIYIWAQEHPDSVRARTMYARSLIAEKKYQEAEKELYTLMNKWPEAVHNDLVILNQSCVGNMHRDFDMDRLYTKLERGKYDGSMPSIFEETFRLYNIEACEWLDRGVMENLFNRIYGLKNTSNTFKAKLAFWEVEFYANLGNLDRAIQAIDKTYKYQKDSFVLFFKSRLLDSAGLYELALPEVQKAIEIEKNKPKFKRLYLDEYLMLESRLKNLINKNNMNQEVE